MNAGLTCYSLAVCSTSWTPSKKPEGLTDYSYVPRLENPADAVLEIK